MGGLFNQFSFWWLVNLGTASVWSLTGVIPPSITAPSGRKQFANGLFKRKKTHTKETTRRWSKIWKLHMLSISLRVLSGFALEEKLPSAARSEQRKTNSWKPTGFCRRGNYDTTQKITEHSSFFIWVLSIQETYLSAVFSRANSQTCTEVRLKKLHGAGYSWAPGVCVTGREISRATQTYIWGANRRSDIHSVQWRR